MLHRATRMRTNQYLPGMHGLSGLEAMCGHCNPWCVPVISQKLDPPKGCALFILYHPSCTKSHKASNQTINESNPRKKMMEEWNRWYSQIRPNTSHLSTPEKFRHSRCRLFFYVFWPSGKAIRKAMYISSGEDLITKQGLLSEMRTW